MFTIKINTKLNGEVEKTSYFEGSCITTKMYFRDKKDSLEDVVSNITKGISTDNLYHHNPGDESWNILHIGYFDHLKEYKNMLIYNAAKVYIMQNGKTIDSIYV